MMTAPGTAARNGAIGSSLGAPRAPRDRTFHGQDPGRLVRARGGAGPRGFGDHAGLISAAALMLLSGVALYAVFRRNDWL